VKARLRALGLIGALPLLLLVYRALAFRGPARPPQPIPYRSVLDLHVHAAGLGLGDSGCHLSPEIRDNWKITAYLRAFGLTREELAKGGDRLSIERVAKWVSESGTIRRAVVLALDGVVRDGELDLSRTEIYVPNEFVARETKPFPQLGWGASINPLRKDALARLEAAKKDGAALVKWLPAIQDFDPADPALEPFYRKLKSLEMPLLVHTGVEKAFTRSDDRLADPRKLELALSLGVTVVAAHGAAPGKSDGVENMDLLLAMFPKYPTLYADISSLTQINKLGYLRKLLLDRRAEGKLVYGSDFPLINTPLVSPYFFPLELTWKMMRRLATIPNPFDRDVALKQALGVPTSVFLHTLGK
jgi:uncharacterized protein